MGIATYPAAGGGVTPKVQTFTSTGTFTAPSNCTYVEVFLVGGGGGGGAANRNITVAGGGGGGGGSIINWRKLSVTGGTAYTVTIGGGGAGSSSDAAASNGSDTTFGSLATAYGGGGGGSHKSDNSAGRGNIRGTIGGTGQSTRGTSGGGAANNFSGVNATTNPFNLGSLNNFGNTSSDTFMGGYNLSEANNPSVPGLGIEGYGGGGWMGQDQNTSGATYLFLSNIHGGATGSYDAAGNNGIANKGGGGSGGSNSSGTTVRSGGSGGSGYAIVVYWS